MKEILTDSIASLNELGLSFWVSKLELCLEKLAISESEAAQETLKLFGGFGTLNDIAFSDEDAPKGMSGEQATKRYFEVVNKLHQVAKQHAT
ncbi:MAG: DUF6966 domain-containing protein [bacterium]